MYNTTKLKVLLVQVVLKPTRPSTEKGNDDQAWIWDHQQTFWHHKSTWWWAFQRWQSKRWISAIHIFQWDQRHIVRRRRHKEYWANNRCNKGWGRLGFCSDHEWRLQGRKGQSIWFVFVPWLHWDPSKRASNRTKRSTFEKFLSWILLQRRWWRPNEGHFEARRCRCFPISFPISIGLLKKRWSHWPWLRHQSSKTGW